MPKLRNPEDFNLPEPTSGKHDNEKPRTALVLGGFANALYAVSVIGTDGAKEYTDNGWQEMENAEERIESALLRHWLADARAKHLPVGESYDKKSKCLHKAHLAWNSLAALELELRHLPLRLTNLPYDKE